MKLGCHMTSANSYVPALITPDVLALQSTAFHHQETTARLVEKHEVGSGYYVVSDPAAFLSRPTYSGGVRDDLAIIKDSGATNGGVSRGSFTFRYRIVGGTDVVMVKPSPGDSMVKGAEVACDVGSQIERKAMAWANDGLLPVADSYHVRGRDTGYPRALLKGQSLRMLHVGGPQDPKGTWTLMAKGSGRITVQVGYPQPIKPLYLSFEFEDGRCAKPTIRIEHSLAGVHMLVWVTATDPSRPLHDLRLVMPEPEGYRGPGFVSLYRANAADPDYFLWHPGYLELFKPFSVCRTVNPSGINNFWTPVDTDTWESRPSTRQWPGFNPTQGMAWERQIDFGNAIGRDLWLNLPHRCTDDFIAQLAALIRDRLDPSLKVYVEYSNEVWNWGYFVKRFACARWADEVNKVTALAASGRTARVSKPAHGLRTGDSVLITCASDAAYNGEFVVESVPDADTFSVLLGATPESPATPIADQSIVAFKVDGLVRTVDSAEFALNEKDGLTLTIDLPDHGYSAGDFLALANCADPDANGTYLSTAIQGSKITLSLVPCQHRPLPRLRPGRNPIEAAPGQKLRCRIVVTNVPNRKLPPEVPQSDASAARWSGRRHRRAHDIMASVLGDRLVRVVAGFTFAGIHDDAIMDQYRADGGGVIPPGVLFAVAPYLMKNPGGAVNVKDAELTGEIKTCSIKASGGTATVTCAGHGYASGDEVQIMNAEPPEYCGLFKIERLDADRFTYPIDRNVPSPSASSLGPSIRGAVCCAKGAPWFREVTRMTCSRDVATAESKGHGFQTGDRVKICNARQDEYNRIAYVRRIDDDRFSYYLDGQPASPAAAPSNQRIWAYRVSAMAPVFEALDDHIHSVLPERLGKLRDQVCTPYGVSLACYESGQHLLADNARAYPAVADLYVECNRDQRMESIYRSYYQMLESCGVAVANHYETVGFSAMFGAWGFVEYQGQPMHETPKLQALLSLARPGAGES